MSDRDLTAGVITEVQKANVRAVHLYKGEFDAGDLLVTDAGHDVDYSGDTYVASSLISHSGAPETKNILVNRTTVSLSGVDQTIIAIMLADDFLYRPATIYLAFLNSAHVVIADPVVLITGLMDAPKIAHDPDSGTSTVTVDIVPRWADFGRRPGRHTNDAEQKLFFPGDKGFEFVTEIPRKIYWGRFTPVDELPGPFIDPGDGINPPGFGN